MNVDNIKKQILGVDVVSFDIFDTLLKRNVRCPSDIFLIVERLYNKQNSKKISSFTHNRIKAESIARKNNTTEEITLDAIYKELQYETPIKSKLKELELETERLLITKNVLMYEIFQYACSNNKKIIVTSDIYLPAIFIKELLETNGYSGYDCLYISSEIKLCKSTGNLFKHILEVENVPGKKILHIGDNWKSDYIKPILCGLKAVHISRYNNNVVYGYPAKKDNDISGNVLGNFLNNTICGERDYSIGYETIGPLLYGFCNWLYCYRKEKQLNNLLFLSRDGYLMHKVYKMMYPEENADYVYVSRRSLTVPLIHKQKTIEEVFNIIPLYLYTSLYVVIDRLGLDYNRYAGIISEHGLNGSMQMTKTEYLSDPRFLSLYDELKDDIYKNSEQEFHELQSYFNSLNIAGNIGIVDLGWYGTIQKTLEKYFLYTNESVHIEGFYIGISLQQDNAHGFVFDTQDEIRKYGLFGFKSLLELLLSANHGSLLKYKGGKCVLYDFEFNYNQKTRNDYEIIKKIQKGALDFVRKYLKISCVLGFDVDLNKSYYGIEKLGLKPKYKDLKTLGDLCFFDNELFYLACPQIKKYKTFKDFIKHDFSPSPWKIGYLRRLLRIPLPYLSIYIILRKIVKKS